MCIEVEVLQKQRAVLLDNEGNADKSAIVVEDKKTGEVAVRDSGLQTIIASRMGISQQRVSVLLAGAKTAMDYLADHEFPAWWERRESASGSAWWELIAPIADRE